MDDLVRSWCLLLGPRSPSSSPGRGGRAHTADPEEDIFDDERERKGRRDEMDKKKELIETFATKAYDGDDSVFAEDAIVQPPYGTIAYFGPHIYFPLG